MDFTAAVAANFTTNCSTKNYYSSPSRLMNCFCGVDCLRWFAFVCLSLSAIAIVIVGFASPRKCFTLSSGVRMFSFHLVVATVRWRMTCGRKYWIWLANL